MLAVDGYAAAVLMTPQSTTGMVVKPELLRSFNLSHQIAGACAEEAKHPWPVPSPLLADLRGRKLVVFEDGCGLTDYNIHR